MQENPQRKQEGVRSMARVTIPSSHRQFLKKEKEQQLINNIDDARCYALQYRAKGEREFSTLSTSPREIYTLDEAERRFSSDLGTVGTEVRIVKVSRYLTPDGSMVPVSVIKHRVVR